MNNNSYICRMIRDNGGLWQDVAKNLNIRVRGKGAYTIFNYGIGADFSNPTVQEARGIIIDTAALEVACWPFRKFGNYQEPYADKIDWSTARVQEKIDGSIVKLWYDGCNRQWTWSTNSMIDAADSSVANTNLSFSDLIHEAVNYKDIHFDDLDKDLTYIYELTSPKMQIVVPYPMTKLWHIGTRSRITGDEFDVDIGIDKPREFPITSLEECIKDSELLNPDNNITQEGYVVVDGNWNRIKVKSPAYFAVHRIAMTKRISKRDALMLLVYDEEMPSEFNEQVCVQIKYYDYKLSEFRFKINRYIYYARDLWNQVGHDRKKFAEIIKDHPFNTFGFRAVDNPEYSAENIPVRELCRWIEDYRYD